MSEEFKIHAETDAEFELAKELIREIAPDAEIEDLTGDDLITDTIN